MRRAISVRSLLPVVTLAGFAAHATAFACAADPPAPEKREQIGTVLDKPIYRDQLQKGESVPDELRRLFAGPVMKKYCEEHKADVTPTAAEIDTAAAHFKEKLRDTNEEIEDELRQQLNSVQDALRDKDLPAKERQELERLQQRLESRLKSPGKLFAEFLLNNWKLQRHLYDNFGGGRILWQQAGIEAFDAMRTWLETQEKNGEFEITDAELRKQFYAYWTTQKHGPFLTDDKERIRKEFLEREWAPPAEKPVAAEDEKTPFSELINRLKNENPAPQAFERATERGEFPKDYDWAAQTRVIDAWIELDRRIEESLPELAQHLDDKDYSVTFEGDSGGTRNRTVGNICHRLIHSHVVPYLFSPDLPNPRWPWDADRTTLPKWLEKRKGQRLSEIQLEVVLKAKKHFQSIGRRKISNEDRADVIAELDEIAETITAGKPVRTTSLGDGIAFRNYRFKSSRTPPAAAAGGK